MSHTRRSTWCSLRRLGPVRRCAIFVRGDMLCAWCGVRLTKDTATIDHVVPRARGGADDNTNLVGACEDCNQTRSPDMPMPATCALPVDLVAGRALAIEWYPWAKARFEDGARRKRDARAAATSARLAAKAEGLGGDAFPFGAAAP